jgi:biofilm PGA synthesis N-glycosyltransferase PgaC
VTSLSYAVVTPAHNEAASLPRLASCMAEQTVAPREWILVDDGSTDETPRIVGEIERELPWARVLSLRSDAPAARGGPVVRAFHAGVEALSEPADIVVKLDADISFTPDFFEGLLAAFGEDPRLGIAGATCYELDGNGHWRPERVARGHVRGAARAYRRECLADVLPLEERMGWDGIDELKAQVGGWRTGSVPGLGFHHHRALGAREGKWEKWVGQGDMAHFMGYRFSYLALRALYRALREPSAVGMVWGYLSAVVRRRARYDDPAVRAHLRSQQALRRLPHRVRESFGRDGASQLVRRTGAR